MPEHEVFISYKQEHAEAARMFKDLIEMNSAEKVKGWVAEADIKLGQDWLDEIWERLESSALLVLFYTDPRDSWDWCLMEVGMFLGLHKRERTVINICTTEPPDTLAHLQSIVISPDGSAFADFLRDFFGTDKYLPSPDGKGPNHRYAAGEERLIDDAKTIYRSLVPRSRTTDFAVKPPGEENDLRELIRMADDLRWAVLAPFRQDVIAARGDEAKLRKACNRLKERLTKSEDRAQADGYLDPYKVASAFADKAEKTRILEMFAEWGEVRGRLVASIDADAPAEEISAIQTEILALNRDFMVLASRRYAEVVHEGL